MKKENLILLDGEEILIQTNSMFETYKELTLNILIIIGVPALIMCIGYGGFFLINGFLFIQFINIIFGVILIISSVIILVFEFNNIPYIFSKKERESYYITTRRIIKIKNKKSFFRTQRLKEMSYNEIGYIIYWHDSIEIVKKGVNGELHYQGNETDYQQKPRKTKSLDLFLEGNKADKVKENIRDTLNKRIPMKRHPNLMYLFLSTM